MKNIVNIPDMKCTCWLVEFMSARQQNVLTDPWSRLDNIDSKTFPNYLRISTENHTHREIKEVKARAFHCILLSVFSAAFKAVHKNVFFLCDCAQFYDGRKPGWYFICEHELISRSNHHMRGFSFLQRKSLCLSRQVFYKTHVRDWLSSLLSHL